MEQINAPVKTEILFAENNENITHLRHMLANLLEMQDVAGLTVNEKKNVLKSIRAIKSSISALEVQVFA